MADDRRIVIELKVGGGDNANPTNINESKDLVSILKNIQHPGAWIENKLLKNVAPGKAEFISYAVGKAKSIAKGYALYYVNRHLNLTEDYKAEQNLNNALSIISHVGEGFTTILSGAIVGAKAGGGLGAVAGAVVGAGAFAANTTLNAIQAHDEEKIRISTMNIQANYQQVRLGLIDDGRGTQN